MQEYTFKKSTAERYDIHFKHGEWATFTIDENGGLFNCLSSYGDYNYCWPNHGRETFKHFIIEITHSPDYILGKVTRRTFFDFDKALEQWNKTIIKMRKDNDIQKDVARRIWDFVNEEIDAYAPVHLVQEWLYQNDDIHKISGGEPWYYFETDLDYEPGARYFAHEIMPMFADILKKEIEQNEVAS